MRGTRTKENDGVGSNGQVFCGMRASMLGSNFPWEDFFSRHGRCVAYLVGCLGRNFWQKRSGIFL